MNIIWFYFLAFIASCFTLSYSGTWIIKSLVKIARFLRWKSFVVSSLLMGVSTSLPEVFIGVMAALHNEPEIILGVVIGSNIITLTLIIGIVALKDDLILKGKTVQRSTIYAIFYSLLPFFLLKDRILSRGDGIILLASFIIYFSQLVSEEERFSKVLNNYKRNLKKFKSFLFSFLILFVGIVLLLASSEGIIFSTLKIAEVFKIPTVIISIFLIAIGTSLPEITFGIKSINLKQKGMVIGNMMGSIVTNSTLVLGLTSLIFPIIINDFTSYLIGIIFILITCFSFLIFARTDHKITKKEAILLIVIYLIFTLIEVGNLNIGQNTVFNIQ